MRPRRRARDRAANAVDVLHQEAAPERVGGSKADAIARIIALCETPQAYGDLR